MRLDHHDHRDDVRDAERASRPEAANDLPSLEERLRVIKERCRLLADVFHLQAESTFRGRDVRMSMDSLNALSELCYSSATDLERLVRELPGTIANWTGGRSC